MTIKYELTKLHNKNKLIIVCMISQDQFNKDERDTLEIKIKGTYYAMKPRKGYKNYSHGICDNCFKTYYSDLYEKKMIQEKKY